MRSGKIHLLVIFIILVFAMLNGMNNFKGWSALPVLLILSPMLAISFFLSAGTILFHRKVFKNYVRVYISSLVVLISSIFLIGDDGGYGTQYFLGSSYDLEGFGSNTLPTWATYLGTTAGIIFYIGSLNVVVMLFISARKDR